MKTWASNIAKQDRHLDEFLDGKMTTLEKQKLQDDVGKYKWYPVLSISMVRTVGEPGWAARTAARSRWGPSHSLPQALPHRP